MNPAQKRTWWTLVISLLTLLAAGVITALRLNGTIEPLDHRINSIIGICATIPLILIVLLAKFYPGKVHDERDMVISNKSTIWGIVGTFGFMALAGYMLSIQDLEGTIKRMYLLGFVYVTAFVWFFLSSFCGLVVYYFSDIFAKKHNLQGESK